MVQKASRKLTKRQYQTVISDFGRALVRVLSPSPWSWLPTAAWGAGCRPKGLQMRWSIRLKWHIGLTSGALLAHRKCFLHPVDLGTMHCRHHFWTSIDGLYPSMCTRLWSRAVLALMRIMQYGAQNMEYGIWSTIWKMGCGMWNMEYSKWCTA